MESRRSGPVESVWDYPRPPRVEATAAAVRVEAGGRPIATTARALRVLETSHPPVYYVPFDDVVPGVLRRAEGRTFCEFKGQATYWDVVVGDDVVRRAAWSYEEPAPGYEGLRGHVAFYPSRVDGCYVSGERVRPQEGDFYGGWITSGIEGPFKGGPGTQGW